MFHRREVLKAASATLSLAALGSRAWGWEDKPKKKILMFTKSAGFEHSSIHRNEGKLSHAEQVLTDFGKEHGYDVVATKDGTVFDSSLDDFDAFFFYTTGDLTQAGTDKTPPMTKDGKARLLEAVAKGKGFLASHCGSDTFHSAGPARQEQKEPDPYIAMLGGEFISHGPQQSSRQIVTSADFPGFKGLEKDFHLNEEWYSLKNFPDDLHVLLVQDTQGMDGKDYQRPAYPATWIRKHHEGRVFYTSMGHREDVWTNPTFQQIVLAGLDWTTGRSQFDPKPNIADVTPGAHVMPPE